MKLYEHLLDRKPLRQKVVVLTGAGISAESGLATFRDNNGLWKQHDAKKLASAAGICKPFLISVIIEEGNCWKQIIVGVEKLDKIEKCSKDK